MRAALSILPLFWLGCTAGDGTGAATGTVSIPACHLEGELDLDLAEVQGGEGRADLSGYFRFRYTRGRPAQRFP